MAELTGFMVALLYSKEGIECNSAAGLKSLRVIVFKQKNVLVLQVEDLNQIETTELSTVSSPKKYQLQKTKLNFTIN